MSWTLLDEAKKIISIHSVTYDSDKEIVDYLLPLLKSLNAKIDLQEETLLGKKQFNVIATWGEGDRGLLLNSHLDTVSPGDFSLWDKTGGNPFRATVHDDKIYGLGTADVKLDILCKIKAIESFQGQTFKHPLTLVGTFGEESGLEGAKRLVESKKLKALAYALVGEPSNLSIVYAHKGHIVCEITLMDKNPSPPSKKKKKISRIDFLGRAAHSSTPHLGENAILKGLQFIKHHRSQINVLNFSGGELVNVIPSRATLWFEGEEKIIPKTDEGILSVEEATQIRGPFSEALLMTLDRVDEFLKKISFELKRTTDPEFDPPVSLLNLSVVESLDQGLKLQIGIRTLPTLESQPFMSDFQERLIKILNEHPELHGEFRIIRESPSMYTRPNSHLVEMAQTTLREMQLQDTLVTKATCTEAAIYHHTGMEAIVWGPGLSVGNVHRPNEYNYVHHLDHAVHFYRRMIEKFCVKGVK